ncbi:FIGNL1-interacting regulator of recombination and mitosis-like, partial [Battus philenor]|uniref:FIGNL1-interacting regulator of recombination and mitosis-like n=1 Tax=Battus philenor TaxID=42288 RepID=UPI0035CF6106
SLPITIGNIIFTVFSHCKESETRYRNHLNSVEIQLKDLFRTCHELQLIYLNILLKHFIFDVTEEEQLTILLKVFDINLRICETVQILDVRTMAEQWKSYITLCEKYSDSLMDKTVYNQCTELLCNMAEYNIQSALENDEHDKVVLRSTKVASFCIKILLKINSIFKHAPRNKHEHMLHLFTHIYMCDSPVLEVMLNKSQDFIRQMNLLIINPSQSLLLQLVIDKRFLNCLCQYDIRKIREDKQLGFFLLLISTINCGLQTNTASKHILAMSTTIIINCINNIIPYCHIWFHGELKFKSNIVEEFYGAEDYLLAHLIPLCTVLDSEGFAVVENCLYEALLNGNCCIALFVSHMWLMLARLAGHQYTLSLIISFCEIYEKFEKVKLFNNSPQEINLRNTLETLFESLPNNERALVVKHFDIKEKNYGLWSVLRIKNVPVNIHHSIQETLLENLSTNFEKLSNTAVHNEQDMHQLVKIMKISSTCSFIELNNNFEECVIAAWVKACPKNLFSLPKHICQGMYWYYSFVEALALLTNNIIRQFCYVENVLKVFQIMSNIISMGNNDLVLLLIPIFCKIFCYLNVKCNSTIDTNILQKFKNLIFETEPLIKRNFINELHKYKKQNYYRRLLIELSAESLEEENERKCALNVNEAITPCKLFTDCVYVHKCIVNSFNELSSLNKTVSQSNFEIDINKLFDSENGSEEPMSKKAKLESSNDVDMIIRRLENDTLILSNIDGITNEYMERLIVVYNRLKNILS